MITVHVGPFTKHEHKSTPEDHLCALYSNCTCAFGRTRAHVVRHDAARGHIVPFHVDHQKVVPLPEGEGMEIFTSFF